MGGVDAPHRIAELLVFRALQEITEVREIDPIDKFTFQLRELEQVQTSLYYDAIVDGDRIARGLVSNLRFPSNNKIRAAVDDELRLAEAGWTSLCACDRNARDRAQQYQRDERGLRDHWPA